MAPGKDERTNKIDCLMIAASLHNSARVRTPISRWQSRHSDHTTHDTLTGSGVTGS